MSFLWPLILGAVLLIFGGGVGYHVRDQRAQSEAAIALAAFERRISEANSAYASQKVIDDKELASLKALVDNTPPDPTIAIKRETAKRIGVIR